MKAGYIGDGDGDVIYIAWSFRMPTFFPLPRDIAHANNDKFIIGCSYNGPASSPHSYALWMLCMLTMTNMLSHSCLHDGIHPHYHACYLSMDLFWLGHDFACLQYTFTCLIVAECLEICSFAVSYWYILKLVFNYVNPNPISEQAQMCYKYPLSH